LSEATEQKKRRSPKMMISIGIGVVIAIALIAVVSALTGGKVTTSNGLPTSKLVGQHVKAFSLDGLNGGVVKSPWSEGRASVIVFFASYCGPCQHEMPKIAKYIRTHSPSPVEVVAVDADDKRSFAQAMIKKDDVTFPVAFDPNGAVTTVEFGFPDVPESVFVSAKGVVKGVYFGAIPKDTLASNIKGLKRA
jgi:thiol-disulfide isomerase/thioredoxin